MRMRPPDTILAPCRLPAAPMVGIDERLRACQLCQQAEMIAAMATAFSNMIDGRPVESTDRTSDINPSNVQDIVGEFARGTTADVEHAVAAAKQAFVKWSVSNPQERFDI